MRAVCRLAQRIFFRVPLPLSLPLPPPINCRREWREAAGR